LKKNGAGTRRRTAAVAGDDQAPFSGRAVPRAAWAQNPIVVIATRPLTAGVAASPSRGVGILCERLDGLSVVPVAKVNGAGDPAARRRDADRLDAAAAGDEEQAEQRDEAEEGAVRRARRRAATRRDCAARHKGSGGKRQTGRLHGDCFAPPSRAVKGNRSASCRRSICLSRFAALFSEFARTPPAFLASIFSGDTSPLSAVAL
jgi:hypothetical protein